MEIVVGILAVLLILIILRSTYENTHYEIENKEIYNEKIKDDVKVLFFADMHNNVYGKNNQNILADIEKLTPDIILISGDLFMAKKADENKNARAFLQELLNKYKVVYVFGNHETKLRNKEKYGDCINAFDEYITNENLYLVNNKLQEINVNGNNIQFVGYEADLKYYKKGKKCIPEANDIENIWSEEKLNEDKVKILLSHNPDFARAYEKLGFDYIFSGHNHGGIVRLPFVGGVISTSYKIFPKYYGGEYNVGKSKMFVTRGFGSHTIRFRLFNKPQIHIYTFKHK